MACAAEGLAGPDAARVDVFLVALGDAAVDWTFGAASRLRTQDLDVAFDLKGRSMKAQMQEANRQEARFVAIVGDDELAAGEVQLKDMETGEQSSVRLEDIPERVKA